ncbi:hypothetical protein H9X96_10350 [Pedobacter sp. N36a]|uniref:hypothetical protein n=1 Tax=Pedobacter sp. N36a TaxID=2767996 RepID=UPI0016571172|nr:hypothetical protein [Pedobacter sp. N36a]MBC8986173.1 hypothetical protein [Pedobacter sp. N36a]
MIKFYFLIGLELIFSPFLYLFEWLKKINGKFIKSSRQKRVDGTPIGNEILFVVHEWAGYPFTREKTIKYINKTFACGLKFHFDRLSNYDGKYNLRKILTISDCNDDYVANLKKQDFFTEDFEIYPVLNKAMDFSGYSFAIDKLVDSNKEQIVFLTNTSVDSMVVPFIDQYVNIFKSDPSLGLLGISYSTKIYQTLIKNNFRPHLQSFFLVSRSSVLKELVKSNGGSLPGSEEDYKLSIIRFGEVQITEQIQKLGFKVAVITEDKELYTLPDSGPFYNGFFNWKLPFNDYRLSVTHPNRINEFKKSS